MKKEWKRNLSIIIPHYNTPDLLEKLIRSIPADKDIQIVVVDDNSSVELDKLKHVREIYGQIVEFYINDSHVKGAGACRNIGLKHADGKWLLFADADDFYVEGMYDIVSAYFELDYDEVFFTPTSIYLDSGKLCNRHEAYEKRINQYIAKPSRENLLRIKLATNAPWASMIRHSVVYQYNIRFDEVLFFNDIMFMTKVGYHSNKVAVSQQIIYCVTKNKGSLTIHIEWDAYKIRLQEFLKVCRFIKKKYSKRDFKNLDCTGLGMICMAVRQHYGLKKYLYIMNQFFRSKIPLFSWRQLNFDLLKKWVENRSHRKLDSNYYVKQKM